VALPQERALGPTLNQTAPFNVNLDIPLQVITAEVYPAVAQSSRRGGGGSPFLL
jgi:hypothetical protein